MTKNRLAAMNRYAAKLLFQFRVVVDGNSGKRRLCEERIVVVNARSANTALAKAKRRGRDVEYDYENADGNRVYFEFIGVLELIHLGLECDSDEVWYEFVQRLLPLERSSALIPSESDLCAVRNEESTTSKRDRP